MTKRNYLTMTSILGRRGIPLVAVQYPMRSVLPLRRMLAGQPNVHFVDAEQVFKDAVAREAWDAYFTDQFAGDFGHTTPRGAALLAETVAPVVLQTLGLDDGAPRTTPRRAADDPRDDPSRGRSR